MEKEGLWAGLNCPEESIDRCDVVVFGIPFDKGVSFRNGAGEAPNRLREITYTIPPTTERFKSLKELKVRDIGDIEGSSRLELFRNVEDTVCGLVQYGKFFTMIGGDHSTTIPVLNGINRAVKEPIGIIHIDAHFDLCDKLNGDSLSHGSTERRALELDCVSGIENIFFIGVRSIEEDELKFIQENGVNAINAYDFNKLGVEKVVDRVTKTMRGFKKIYLTIDIDCLDPAYAGGTGTPQFGGLTSRELLNLLEGLFELPIIGFDVVEVAPKLDPSLNALFAARKIITECWGHYLNKKQGGCLWQH